ncbi:RidA family protein [Glutamicibacter endophyticus]|uniref:RidA family protein n=1 Tax=Glutamicibacter endophyticus TaxID=1522174 RepID=UPI003AF1557B
MINHHFSPNLFQSDAPFSHLTRLGDIGFTAGIIGQCPTGGSLVSSDVRAQTEQMMQNLAQLLTEVGLDFSCLLKATIYLTDYADFESINEVYASFLPTPYPARTTVQTAALPLGAKVQIESVVTFESTE